MKITKSQLKQIIKEELEGALNIRQQFQKEKQKAIAENPEAYARYQELVDITDDPYAEEMDPNSPLFDPFQEKFAGAAEEVKDILIQIRAAGKRYADALDASEKRRGGRPQAPRGEEAWDFLTQGLGYK